MESSACLIVSVGVWVSGRERECGRAWASVGVYKLAVAYFVSVRASASVSASVSVYLSAVARGRNGERGCEREWV